MKGGESFKVTDAPAPKPPRAARMSEVLRQSKLTVEAFTSPHEFSDPREYLDYLHEQLCELARVCNREPVELPKAWCK